MSALDDARADGEDPLSRALAAVGHLLPAQGPIRVFIHHNVLHAYEDRPFEEAVVAAGRRLGCQPFATEAYYRGELARGRIHVSDIEAVLRRELGARGDELVCDHISRRDLRKRVVAHGIPDADGVPLSWLLSESDALGRFRGDLPEDVREKAMSTRRVWGVPDPEGDEAHAVEALWRACLDAVGRAPLSLPSMFTEHVRHRDLLLAAHAVDTDTWIDPPLIRFIGAFVDQGMAHWAMPGRERGLHACFVDLYCSWLASACGPWAGRLRALAADDRKQDRDGHASLRHSLRELGVAEPEWQSFLSETALALRGWAGMVHQLEERPDRVPRHALPATLVDFLAVRLLLERAALEHALQSGDIDGALPSELRNLRPALRRAIPPARPPSDTERAWPLFHAAQLSGLDAATIDTWTIDQVDAFEGELGEIGGLEQRRVLQVAYERHLRERFFTALTQHTPDPTPAARVFQAIFCLDEREESIRRHLEEVEPEVETFGAAGFFGVAMYYKSATDAHPRPLCPVAIRPEHYVTERSEGEGWQRLRHIRRRGFALVTKNLQVGSRTLVRGSVVMALLGTLWIIPLVLRVVFPWLAQRLSRIEGPAGIKTRLRLDLQSEAPPIGRHAGFTPEEMADIVLGQLENIGIRDRMARLVLVIGHGSSSLNNPHESAYDCGACGGGHGGPNARALAQMANDPRVRGLLAERGWSIPDTTWFVAAEHNSANDAVDFFDVDLVPDAFRADLRLARSAVRRARERDAHERCRRFEDVPAWWSPRVSLLHVEGRAADLAQPRPERGHATNAFCVIGRRPRTRGLFLDRRAFLVSYDPSSDADGRILERLLGAVVPVVAGINLEYYFGFVDPSGYGSGTKLPHNVTSLLGVMDGAQSDLRTGLPWQMLDIHEPVRLTMVIEAPRERVSRILRAHDELARLVDNRWMFVATLDPEGDALWELGRDGDERFESELTPPRHEGDSASFYRGKRGHLPFARLGGARRESV